MLAALVVALRSLALICRGHRAVALENLALRQQLAVFKRTVRRPRLRHGDRLFWMLLANAWRDWRTALIVGGPGHRCTLASPLVPPPMGAALSAGPSRPPAYECRHSYTRGEDGRANPL